MNLPGVLALWVPGQAADAAKMVPGSHGIFRERAWLAVELHRGSDDDARLRELLALASALRLRRWWPAATCTCTCARAARLQDTMTAIRHRAAGGRGRRAPASQWRAASAPRRAVLATLSAQTLLAETRAHRRTLHVLAGRAAIRLSARAGAARTHAGSWLRQLTEQGMRWRWPEGVPATRCAR